MEVNKIDLLTIDVEGFDLKVLKGLDNYIKPKIIAIEISDTYNSKSHFIEDVLKSDVNKYLEKNGYKMFAKTLRTAIYSRKEIE